VTGLLRHQLGYDGVVFSDDLDMKAISDNFTPQEAAARAVLAGVDALLFAMTCRGGRGLRISSTLRRKRSRRYASG